MLLFPRTLSVPCMVHVTLCYETNKLINSVCNKQELPEQWKELIIVPVYEMGNKTDCRNYRGISLLLSRLTTFAEENSGSHHCGF
jgi:hypothetical protein